MNALIIIVPFILLFLIFKKIICWRSSALAASVIWGVLLVFITELLSIFNLINFKFILLSWGLITLMLCIVAFCLYLFNADSKINLIPACFPQKIEFNKYLASLLILLTLNVLILGLIAFIAAPNNSDSVTYHMSRVIHWIQNANIAHYPTNITRQLYSGPFAEFVILHLQILSDGDRFANLVQWFSMIGSVIGASLIAKQLKADIRGQSFSAVIASAIPMGILQSSTTQNNFVVSFWLVCFVYYLLKLKEIENEKSVLIYSCAGGIALGLAFLTKATAYVISLPFLIWLFISVIKKFKIGS